MSGIILSVVPLGEQDVARLKAVAGDRQILCFKNGGEVSTRC